MITISTNQGQHIEIVLEHELCHPVDMGAHVRAYCHIHGSDHQRSLSINKLTGWATVSTLPVKRQCWLLSGIALWQNA